MPANRRPSTSPLHLGMDPVTTPMDAAFNTQQHSPSSSTHLNPCRSRTQSMLPMVRDEVFLLHNTSQNTINIPVPASLHTKMSSSFSNDYVPSYISSRSANSLISFSRPTRIQAKTLHYLNKILDELLEQILSSAKSLATDRIKSDGILKVLGGQSGSGSGAGALLAKNAVLEAELELRNYLEGQRKEGGKMPLGLSATSRWDGTDTFPVQRAYEALRIRCQYYSTLGDLEDPSPHSPADQNIMSADGRPVATITPGVAIYVTALLEFIAEYILQNVGRVIERDNSDEAELGDLSKALEEDEGSTYWWKRLAVRGELLGIETAEQDRAGRGKVKKPWKVPDADEWDEAAGRRGVERHSVSMGKTRSSGVASITDSRVQGSLSLSGHESRDSTSYRATSPLPPLASSQLAEAMTASGSAESPVLSRRTSSDKGWFSKRRGSFRASSDFLPSNVVISAPPKGALTTADVNSSAFEDTPDSDDFDSLMMSGQTMKVSLTPNRLRSIEVAGEKEYFDDQEDGEGKRSSRRRPGTLSPLPYRENEPTTPKGALPSPSLKGPSRMSLPQQASEPVDDGSARSVSRQGSIGGYRSPKYVTKKAAPPSSYRSVDAARSPSTDIGNTQLEEEDSLAIDGALPAAKRRQKDLSAVTGSDISPKDTRLLPRDETTQRSTNVRDMVDMFNSTPPLTSYNGAFPVTSGSSGRESRQSQSQASSFSNDTLGGNTTSQRKSALSSAGGKVRNLFGRKSSSTNSSLSLAGGFSGRESQEVEAKKSSSVRKLDVDSAHFRSQSDLPMSRSGSAYEVADPPQPSPRRVNGIATNSDSPLTSSFSPNAAAAAAAAAITKPLPVVRTDEMEDTTRRMERDSRLSQEIDPLDVTSGTRQSKDSSLQHHLESRTESSGHRNASGENQSNGNGWKHRASVASSHDPATVGMYQEQRGNYSASDLSSSHNHGTKGELPSRKVPWSYSRQSSNASRRLSGTLPVNRVGSVGSGSAGHASAIDSNAPPSAWSHIQPPLRDEHSEANGAENGRKTPTPSAPSTFAGTSPRSPLLGNKPSDTARVLAQLSQKMRGASSVDECRSLVMQALAAAAVAVRSEVEQSANSAGMMRSSSALSWQTPHIRARSGSASMEIGGHEASLADKKEQYRRSSATLSLAPTRKDIDERGMAQGLHSQTVDVLPSLIVPRQKSKYDAVREQLSPPPKHRHLLFPMAVGYEQSDDSSAPSHKQQGQFAAWLLDGEPFDLVSALVPDKTTGHDKGSELSAATAPHAPVLLSTPAASKDEYGASSRGQSPDTYASADERLQDSPPQDPSILAARRASNVESVRSTYRDASESIHK